MTLRPQVPARPMLALVLTALVLLWAGSALAGDFVDTRISFIFSDDNLLADPGETLVNSPEPDFGPRDAVFFPFESLNSKDNGDETLSHMVIFKEMPGFISGMTTDAALVGRLSVLDSPETNYRSGDIRLSDGGSFLRMRYALGTLAPFNEEKGLTGDADRQLEVTFFPMNSDRFRAGYTYDLSWGGNNVFTDRKSSFATPGVRMRFDYDGFYGLVAAKSTRQLILEEDPTSTANRELGSFWGGLAGLGFVGETFAIETNGGLFNAGRIPKQGIQGKTVMSGGVSVRASIYSDKSVGPARSVDYRLYRNDPEALMQATSFLRTPKVYESFAFRVSTEFNSLHQTLGSFENPLSTRVVPAYAAALRMDGFIKRFAFNVDAVYRDLSFILFNVPSLDPFLALPEAAQTDPEVMVAAKFEYWLDNLNLIPGIVLGVQMPAAYRGRLSQTTNPGDLTSGTQTVVIPEAGTIIPFPDDQDPMPVYSARAQMRWDLSEMMSFIGQLTYSKDENQLGRRRDPLTQTAEYYFRDPNILGFAFFAQARF